MSEELNTNFAFRVNDGYIRSVSIIFRLKIRGYLFCTEMRKGFPDKTIKHKETHIVGGKVDMIDKTPLECGFREWCEETGYGKDIKEASNTMVSKFNQCYTLKHDICVSKKQKLYNRFYIIEIDECPDYEYLESFITFCDTWKKKDELSLESLFFWNNDEFVNRPSNLLEQLISILPNY